MSKNNSKYAVTPKGGIVRGSGECSRCGIRAWRWKSGLESALKLHCIGCDGVSEPDPDTQHMIYLDGSKTAFRCMCGGNVFTKKSYNKYSCNSCFESYEGE